MAERTDKAFDDQEGPCTKQFLLSQLMEKRDDKLGHKVEEILWIGRQYAIYRTDKGVYVQFSDSEDEEKAQRCRFTRISPELCELRYLTSELHARWYSSLFLLRSGSGGDPANLYDQSIAQSIALVTTFRGERNLRSKHWR